MLNSPGRSQAWSQIPPLSASLVSMENIRQALPGQSFADKINCWFNSQNAMTTLLLPLDSSQADLKTAGGKGSNLSRLIRAGFNVPPGFIITTPAYREFVRSNNLWGHIQGLLLDINPQDTPQLESVSKEIRDRFGAGNLSPEIKDQVSIFYQELGGIAVAVRSSATAEDLPGLSFAGQQDTFLNITSLDDLVQGVVACWSSLWTARAIGYRVRNHISHAEVAQAVVVQEMVPSEASGVMFTANPVNGSRFETVIDATFGVGEALVSGEVEPDHFLVDVRSGQVMERTMGAKSISMLAKEEGGLETVAKGGEPQPSISDQQISELTRLGEQVADLFDFPQDIEWAVYQERIYLLQSRPITSLYPLPEGVPAEPLQALFSFGSVQGILDPLTPLGQDAIRLIFAGGASLFGFELDQHTQPVIKTAGGRLWGNVTPVIQNPVGARLVLRIFSAIDPGLEKIINTLRVDPQLGFGGGRLRLSTIRRLFSFAAPLLRRVFHFMRHPEDVALQVSKASQAEIDKLRAKYPPPASNQAPLPDTAQLFHEIFNAFPYAIPEIVPAVAGGLIPFFLLNKISHSLTGSNELCLQVTRGLPNNVTTEMDLELWHTAREIKSDPAAWQHMTTSSPQDLAADYQAGTLPPIAQAAIAKFLAKYGVRGVGEIDIGRKRWWEDPTYIMGVILGYLQIEDPEKAPDAVFQRGEREAESAIGQLQSAARRTFAGGIKARLIAALALRVRAMSGLRESPKFHIVQVMAIIRQGLLENGCQLADRGILEQPEDLFFLRYDELKQLSEPEGNDWKALIRERRASYAYELARKQVPRMLLSDGRAFYEGITPQENISKQLLGGPVSPGLVQARVRVVLDPLNSGLSPGEIMVCPGTDPAWTPLFLTAGGLIMEVGGMMTHGAIVAREYGIPAVVGVDQATDILHTGQLIQLDGTTGEILLLDQA